MANATNEDIEAALSYSGTRAYFHTPSLGNCKGEHEHNDECIFIKATLHQFDDKVVLSR